MTLPLDGIRVIDLTSVVMGPVATQLLADQGADVIAVEDRQGETNRYMGPGTHPQLSGTAMNLMRNKRSIGLDIKHPSGYAALGRLVATADVVITNLRPGSRRRAKLTHEALSAFRSDLIFCAAAGHPVDDELADAPAYDDVIQAGSGIVDLHRRVGLGPAFAPTIMVDKTTGLVIANVVLAALVQRERTGEGADISVAMSEVIRSFLLIEHAAQSIPEPPLGRAGYLRVLDPGRRPYETADGLIGVLPYSEANYRAIFTLGGREDLIDDRLVSRKVRNDNIPSLYADVAEVLRHRSTAEWLADLRAHDIPCSEVATIDEQVAGLPIADHPHAGRYRVTPPLTGAGADPAVVRRPAPLHGEHGPELLAEIGYAPDEIAGLRRDGVVFGAGLDGDATVGP